MAYVANIAELERIYVSTGLVAGNGECVKLVQASAKAPFTGEWKRGVKVRGFVKLERGTAIATFDAAGRYPNKKDGSSHAAIYLSQDPVGIRVIDQWAGRPPAPRTIPFRNGAAKAVNDGDAYHVID